MKDILQLEEHIIFQTMMKHNFCEGQNLYSNRSNWSELNANSIRVPAHNRFVASV